MDIVTGHVGSAHVTSWQDRDLNQGIFGPDTYILDVGSKMAASIITNNEIHIADGTLVMQGCQGVIQKGTYDSISIDNGSSGMKRNDLICAEYTKVGGVESLGWTVIKGTPAASNPSDPSYTSGDIQNGDTPVQVPIYRVSLNGLTIESVTALVNTAQPIAALGTIYKATKSGTTYDNTDYAGASLSLSAGLYLVFANANFAANTTGSRTITLKTTPDGADVTFYNSLDKGDSIKASAGNFVHTVVLAEVRESLALYVNAYQTAGANLSVETQISALRLA